MRNISFILVAVIALSACGGSAETDNSFEQERDSLQAVINGQQEELNAFMASFAEIQEGMSRMAEAEGRVVVVSNDNARVNQTEQIRDDMAYLREVLEQQRERIAQLTHELEGSSLNVESMRTALANLQSQLETQAQRVQELEIQLQEKNVLIESQSEEITRLGEENEGQARTIDEQTQTIDEQDKQLNEAWYVFGKKSELKAQKIIDNGEVLTSGRFNKEYFTSIDIRHFKEVKLYSKSAKLLTNHPAGSYTLAADSRGEYILKITNAEKFWSLSRYLVIQVK